MDCAWFETRSRTEGETLMDCLTEFLLTDWVYATVSVVVVFVILLNITILMVWLERKIVADMQDRLGPMRAGPFGILQTVADGIKLLFKEQIMPSRAEKWVYLLAPAIAVITAFLMFLVVPIAKPISVLINGQIRTLDFVVMDLNIGVLYVLAISSIAVYAVVLAGWSSGSKYPLLGGVRATAQAISYEAAMGLSLVSVVMYSSLADIGGVNNGLSVSHLVELQSGTLENIFGGRAAFLLKFVPAWNVWPLIIPFAIFIIAALAETNRAPFDLAEAEQEIVGGFHTEYSGMRFAMFFLAEYVNIFTMSAVGASLFLGGYHFPPFDGLVGWLGVFLSFGVFITKVMAIFFLFIWLRASVPRFRYDQLMTLGWKRLIPIGLVWLVASTLVLGVRQFGFPDWVPFA